MARVAIAGLLAWLLALQGFAFAASPRAGVALTAAGPGADIVRDGEICGGRRDGENPGPGGTIIALTAARTEFTVIAFIGIILLIGIVMIDVALHAQREEGFSPHDAIHEACLPRFRPIMMTTCAALFAALPLAVGTGDGAELRQPLGLSIIGGWLVSQVRTLYTTPVVFLTPDRFRPRSATRCVKKGAL